MGWQQYAPLALILSLCFGCGSQSPGLAPISKRFQPSRVAASQFLPSQLVSTSVFSLYDKQHSTVSLISTSTGDALQTLSVDGDFNTQFYRPESKVTFLLGNGHIMLRDPFAAKDYAISASAFDKNWAASSDASHIVVATDDDGAQLIYGLRGKEFKEQKLDAMAQASSHVQAFALSPNGELLLRFFPENGAYQLWQYDVSSGNFLQLAHCPSPATFKDQPSAVSISNSGQLLWAVESSPLFIETSDAVKSCAVVSTGKKLELGSKPLIAVLSDDSKLNTLSLDGNLTFGTIDAQQTKSNLCLAPLSFYYVNEQSWAMACYDGTDTSFSNGQAGFSYNRYAIYGPGPKQSIVADDVMAFSIDPLSSTLLVHYRSTFGRLQLIRLQTGEVTERRGYDEDGWIDRL